MTASLVLALAMVLQSSQTSATPSALAGDSLVPLARSKGHVRILHDIHCEVGEAPTWDERTQRLYFVDITRRKIYSSSADGSDLFSIDTNGTVSTVALTTDENLLLATTGRGVRPVNISTRTVGEAIATLPEDDETEKLHFNDGKSSPGGVFHIGIKHRDWLAGGKPGRFYRLHWTSRAVGHLEELNVKEKIGLPNGMDWDNDHCYLADTYNHTITAFRTDADGVPLQEGPDKLVHGRVLSETDKEDGPDGPDGICISKQGNIWVALLGKGKVKAYSSATGEPVNEVTLPVKKVSSATFGGPNLETLYVTSIGRNDDSEHNGAVFAVSIPGESGRSPAYKVKVPPQ